jgi:hypothetical protein
MKKLTILTMILLMAAGLNLRAQTEKNKLFIAGSSSLDLRAGGENDKYGDTEYKYSNLDFEFTPKVGYTVINNMPIGLFIDSYRKFQKDKDDDDKYKEAELLVGPFIRYYFADLVGLKPYAETSVGFGIYRAGSKAGSDDEWDIYDKETAFNFRIGGGLTYFFNDFIGIDMFMGFNHEGWIQKNESEGERSDDNPKYIYNEFLMQMGVVVMLK